MSGQDKVEWLADLCRVDSEIMRMVAIVCDHHGVKNPTQLREQHPDAFHELLEGAESMFVQLGGED